MNTQPLPQARSGMIALIGETNAGKSTLLNAWLGRKVSIVSPVVHTTRNRILGVKNDVRGQLVLLDTPGFVKPKAKDQIGKFTSKVLKEATADVDLLLLVIDAKRLAGNLRRVEDVITGLRERNFNLPTVIALNKVDLLQKDLLLPLMKELDARFRDAGVEQVEMVPVSALQNDGLAVLENIVFSKLPEGEPLFPEDMVSDQREEFLAGEIVREKLLRVLREEVPHCLAVKVEDWEEGEGLLRIQALVIVEKDSQKAIVIGKGGSQLKAIGQAAREELETIFKTKIFLKLFVKTENDWTKSERGLAKVGYEL